MYCTRCGKKIDYDARVCRECEAEMAAKATVTDTYAAEQATQNVEQPVQQPQYPAQPVQPVQPAGSRMEGFGGALRSAIFATVAVILSIVTYVLGVVDLAISSTPGVEGAASSTGVPFLFFMLVTIGMIIPALIKGIDAIKCFKREKSAGRLKPIATLILGIAGVSAAAYASFFVSISFLLMLV